MQYIVVSILGATATDGVANVEGCDTSEILDSRASTMRAEPLIEETDRNTIEVDLEDEPKLKRCKYEHRSIPKQQRIHHGEELLEVQKQLINEVADMTTEIRELKETLKDANKTLQHCLSGIFFELKRGNDVRGCKNVPAYSNSTSFSSGPSDESFPFLFNN